MNHTNAFNDQATQKPQAISSQGLIMENFSGKYNSGMLTAAKDGIFLTDSDIEKGLASVEPVLNSKEPSNNRVLMYVTWWTTGEEDVVHNIFKTQQVWKCFAVGSELRKS
jgi:hypothetical protein